MGVCASIGRHVQQLRDRAGRRPRGAGGHLPAGLPAAARDAAERNPQAARQDSGDAARRQPEPRPSRSRGGRAGVADRPSNSRDCCGDDEIATRRTASGTARRRCRAEVIGVRRGMFGVEGSGDTSGYGRLVRAGGAARQLAAPLRRLLRRRRRRADRPRSARTASPRRVERVVVFRDELTLEVRREHLRRGGAGAARRPGAAVRAVPRRQRRALPRRHGPRTARGLPADVDHPQPPHPRRGRRTRRRPAHAVAVLGVSDHRLARARDLRLLRHHLRRTSRR